MAEIRVGDVMTRNFTHASPNSPILECAQKMIKNRVGSLVLKEGEKLHGIITEKDIVWALAKKKMKNLEEIKAKDIATKKILTIKPEATIEEAFSRMNRKKIRRMPVISNKKIIGYVTLKDIVKFMPSMFNEAREFEVIREKSEKIKRSLLAEKGDFIEAPCEGCGNFDMLEKFEGRLLCESCRDIL